MSTPRRRDPRRLETEEARSILAGTFLAAVLTALLARELGAPGLTAGLAFSLAVGFVCCWWINARLAYAHAAGAHEEAARAAKDARETYEALLERDAA